MRMTVRLPALLSIIICASLSPSQASAQLTDRPDRCLPYGSYARQAADLHNGTVAKVKVEGAPPDIVIDDVHLDGSITLSKSERQTLVARLKASPIIGQADWLEKVKYDELSGFWQDRGYYKVQLTLKASTLSTNDSQQHVALHVHVDEGLQYRLGAITFRSADVTQSLAFPASDLMKQFELREGDVFDASKVRATIESLKVLYGTRGYIDFVATPLTDVDDQTRRIGLIMELDQEKQYRIRKIDVFTANAAVRSSMESSIKPGDVFDFALVQQILKDNASLLPPEVSERDIKLQRTVEAGTVDLRLELEPCPQFQK
jgi:outer membrane protein assembly factor BamA